MAIGIGRRQFLSALGGAAAVWPLAARAEQQPMPVVGFVSGNAADAVTRELTAFRKGLNESGTIEGQNATVEYHWLAGRFDQAPTVMANLVRRQVALIVTPGSVPSLAAKAATGTIPIVFGAGGDPVRLGLVVSLARPGGNATGVNFFFEEIQSKRLRLLHDLVPKAMRIAVLVNPANASSAKSTLREIKQAAPAIGLQVQTTLKASTVDEIDAVFATFARERPDALFVAPDGFFYNSATQLATLAARAQIPATYDDRHLVEAGGLMSYGTDFADMYHQLGIYTGQILKGTKPADLPVVQSTKFELAINLKTAKTLGLTVPSGVLAIADDVIE